MRKPAAIALRVTGAVIFPVTMLPLFVCGAVVIIMLVAHYLTHGPDDAYVTRMLNARLVNRAIDFPFLLFMIADANR